MDTHDISESAVRVEQTLFKHKIDSWQVYFLFNAAEVN